MRTEWKAIGMNITAYALLAGALLVTFFFTDPVKSVSASDHSYPVLQSAPTPASIAQKNDNELIKTTLEQTPAVTEKPVPTMTTTPEPQLTHEEISPGVININTASETVIDTLPGIGPVKAAAIVAWRNENGPFQTLEDLMEVKGIGEKTFARLKPLICH